MLMDGGPKTSISGDLGLLLRHSLNLPQLNSRSASSTSTGGASDRSSLHVDTQHRGPHCRSEESHPSSHCL